MCPQGPRGFEAQGPRGRVGGNVPDGGGNVPDGGSNARTAVVMPERIKLINLIK